MVGLQRSDLDTLLETRRGPCVSVIVPMERAGRDARQNPLRFKHGLDEAEERLVAAGLRAPEARDLLQPARDLLADSHFWNQQSDGLALFLAPGFEHMVKLPVETAQRTVVGARFHVRPLLPAFWPDQAFYLLALSQSEVRLFEGARFGVRRVPLTDVPDGIEDVTRFVQGEKARQMHSSERRGAAVVGVSHGHGGVKDDRDERVWEYVRAVGQGVGETLRSAGRSNGAPLVLASVQYLLSLYREVHGSAGPAHAPILDEGIEGNPDQLSDDELHLRAWPLVAPLAEVQVTSALTRYPEAYGRGEARRDVEGVLVATLQGRVETLLLAGDAMQWGRFDADKGRARLHDAWRPGDDDLLDLAAAQTVQTGGVVYTLPAGQMPEGRPLAALLRY